MEKLKVKILGISCTHRKGRNTTWMLLNALKAAEKFGRRISEVAEIQTELVDLSFRGKELEASIDSRDDYIARELIPKMAEADGIIFSAPVFNSSYPSRFILLIERMRRITEPGYFTNKVAGAMTIGYMIRGGQELCLQHMANCLRSLEMVPVDWGIGCTATSGPPYGPAPGEDDGTIIGVKNDKLALWQSTVVGRRVTEVALLRKAARKRLGSLYEKEFIQFLKPPHGQAPWEWAQLDKKDEDYLAGLTADGIKALDMKIISQPRKETKGKPKIKIMGISCDHTKGSDTAWLVLHSLKAVEKFGRRVESVVDFETEFVDLADERIRACLNCDERYEIPNKGFPWQTAEYATGFGCIIKNDYLAREVFPKMADSDGFIIGSPASTLTASSIFRILCERWMGFMWKGYTACRPTANIAVGGSPWDGPESCLEMMNIVQATIELVPVGWPLGTPAVSGTPPGSPLAGNSKPAISVGGNQLTRFLSIYNARRVAEFALLSKLGKQEVGPIFSQEFQQVLHPPFGKAPYQWTKLDEAERAYMNELTPKALTDMYKQT